MTIHWGVCFAPTMAAGSLPGLAGHAEHVGLDELWVWEDCFAHAGIASAAIALASTNRLRVGIGLLPAPLRPISLTAMEVATLANAYPHRFIPGMGHGVQDWMRQAGVKAASPMTLLREQVTALRELLAGEELSVDGRYVKLDKVRLQWPPAPAPPLMIGGTGDKTVALAGELSDGLLLSAAQTPAEVKRSAELARSQQNPELPVVLTQIVTTGPDAEERRRREVANWRGDGLDAGIGSAGDAHAVASSLNAMVAAGATHLVIQPAADEDDIPGLLRFVAEEVRPLVNTFALGSPSDPTEFLRRFP